MSKLTKKKIIAAASEATGVKAEYIELGKIDGFYYWAGKAGSIFSEATNYLQNLEDYPLQTWVSDFQIRVDKHMNDNQEHKHFNDYIESINWEVEYED